MRGEKLLSVAEAVAWLREEVGLTRSKLAVWGWVVRGVRGVRLEAVSVGGRWYTSAGALRRFVSASTREHAAEYGAPVAELRL